jgi:DNA-binding response OmpR family regulator
MKERLAMGMRVEPARASAALVVEDDEVIAHVLRLLLQKAGYSVARARDRRSIRTYVAEAAPPQLMTLDWTLPDVSGLTVLRWIRSTPAWQDVPVLLVTGRSPDERDLVQALKYDGVAYVGKPFTATEFYGAIEGLTTDFAAAHSVRLPRPADASAIAQEYACQQ